MAKDLCFKCGKQGHWAQNCPSNHPMTKASSPLDTQTLPVLRCHCGVACTVYVSHSAANRDRKYYSRKCKCDNNDPQGRNFYKWCDAVKAPMCSCGAGACTINICRDEKGKETKYFTCRIRTGHGACGFSEFDRPQISPNSWPRSKKIGTRISTLSPQHGDLPNIKTHQIYAVGNSPNGYAEVPQNAFRNDTQLSDDPLRTSSLETSFTAMEKGGTNTALESMEPPDNNTMLQAAKDTLYSSVSPLIECGPFVERLVESIQGLSIVAGMESTVQDNCNQAVPSIAEDIEKCLYDTSDIYAETFATVTDTGSYLQPVHQAASRIKDTICQMEKLEAYLLKIAKDVGKSKRYLQATYQELTKLQVKQDKSKCNKDNIK